MAIEFFWQLPTNGDGRYADAEKRRRADFIVDSSHGIEPARQQVREILAKVATMPKRL